ncbi:MAG: hypothetical protein EA396_06285 [Anaerolineaceae bacterium]|nr:MAG: hypothetical protein EA396_06285 [Anaerolineaceae bacterium]
MWRVIVLCLLILLSFSPVGAQQERDILDDAEAAYHARDYARAIMLYRSLVDDGINAPEILFNLGNAYYEDGQIGLAMLHYLRAQRQNPRNMTIDASIMRVRAIRANYQSDPAHIIDNLASTTYTIATERELATVALIVWSGWFVLLGLSLVRWKRTLRRVLALSALIVLVLSVLSFARLYADTYRPGAVITELATPVLSGPSNEYLEMFELYSGAEVRILERQGGWARFILPDGRQGWITRFAFEYVDFPR